MYYVRLDKIYIVWYNVLYKNTMEVCAWLIQKYRRSNS